MKFKVTMKDPDTLHDAIADAVKDELKQMNLGEDEKEALQEIRANRYAEIAGKWFEYGEYLTVEIDTEAKTATVCERI